MPHLLAAGGAAGALASVHQRLGYALVAVLVIGALLSLWAVRDQRRLPTVRAYLWLAFAAISLQAVLGIALVIAGRRPPDGLHFLYGPLTWVSLPFALLMARGPSVRREAWILAAGFAVAFLLAMRALMTG